MKIYKEMIDEVLAKEKLDRCDFHSHTFFSDGVLLPMEHLRRAKYTGHQVMAITDHISLSNIDIIPKIARDCELAYKHWGIAALPGAELTHVPAAAIDEVATKAREAGAVIIIVHGETIVEPVEKGTNAAAVQSKEVDLLAHPGLLTKEEAQTAQKNEVFIEITSRGGHSLANGHVAKEGKDAKVKFIQNTDTHAPGDMINYEEAQMILKAAALNEKEIEFVLQDNIRALLNKLTARL